MALSCRTWPVTAPPLRCAKMSSSVDLPGASGQRIRGFVKKILQACTQINACTNDTHEFSGARLLRSTRLPLAQLQCTGLGHWSQMQIKIQVQYQHALSLVEASTLGSSFLVTVYAPKQCRARAMQ